MAYQNLFNLLSEEYNLNLLESELQEIIRAVHQDENTAKEEELLNKWIEQTDMRLMFNVPYEKVSDKLKEEIKQFLNIPNEDFRQWSSVKKHTNTQMR